MDDPQQIIANALKDGWNLSGDLAVANIRFSTGWYDKSLDAPQISVTLVLDDDEPFELGYGTIRVFSTYQIDVWVKVKRTTGKGPGTAKKWKWDMRQEVKRIVKANMKGLTDLEYLWLDDIGRSMDEPDSNPPLLRYSLNVTAVYDI